MFRKYGVSCFCLLYSILVIFSSSTVLAALETVRIETPATAFSVKAGKASAEAVPDGVSFVGESFETATLSAQLQLPPAEMAEAKALRLVLFFRTTPKVSGARLESITLPDGRTATMNLSGDYMKESKANTFRFEMLPRDFSGKPIVKLVVRYAGGFEGGHPGEFVLKGVSVDYAIKAEVRTKLLAQTAADIALNPAKAETAAAAVTATNPAIFEKPRLDMGLGIIKRLDLCRVWAGECGQPAADAFCVLQGYQNASKFTAEGGVGETVVISSMQVCRNPACSGFARIECQ